MAWDEAKHSEPRTKGVDCEWVELKQGTRKFTQSGLYPLPHKEDWDSYQIASKTDQSLVPHRPAWCRWLPPHLRTASLSCVHSFKLACDEYLNFKGQVEPEASKVFWSVLHQKTIT